MKVTTCLHTYVPFTIIEPLKLSFFKKKTKNKNWSHDHLISHCLATFYKKLGCYRQGKSYSSGNFVWGLFIFSNINCTFFFSTTLIGLISTSGPGSTPASSSSVNISATISSQSHPSSSTVPVSTSGYSLFTSQRLTATLPTANVSVVPSSQIVPSSGIPIVNSSYLALLSSLTPTVPSTNVSATSSLQADPSSGVPVMTSSYVVVSFSSTPTLSPENVSATVSLQSHTTDGAAVVTSSFVVFSSSIRPTVSSANVSETALLKSHPLSDSYALRSMVSSFSLRPTWPSVLVSATSSFLTRGSNGTPVVTSSYVVSSSLLRPSSQEAVITSSAVAVPSGIYVRFGISVPLNQSVKNNSFANQLGKGIFAVYQNGSLGASSGNLSVNVS